MVRREGTAAVPAGSSAVVGVPRCAFPAGVSPARVIAGEPGSRPAPEAERPIGEAWCQEPFAAKAVNGEQQRGPQHQVKPAASSEEQSESRAIHVGAKATSAVRESGWTVGLGGVWGAARAEGEVRNTGGPSATRVVPQSSLDKPKAKRGAAQRESEGVVVLLMAAQKNAAGGKDPCFSHADEARRCEGMTGQTESNSPTRPVPGAQVPRSRSQLHGSAKWSQAQADRRGLSVSRMREIRTYGLNGGPASGCEVQLNERPAGGRIYQ